MNVLRVLLIMLRLLPARDDDDILERWRIAEGIVAVTDDEHEQNLLASIARWESFYRADVGECRRRGPQGELGAWQILARSPAERAALCLSYEGDARIAVERIRESVKACSRLPEAERLAVYARGRCDSREGQRLSRTRWIR